MPPVRIWLNRNFATSVHLVRQLRENRDGTPVEIFGSHVDLASPLLTACDYSLTEPDAAAPDFVDRALELCGRHRIDVFLPVAGQLALSARRAEFAAAGTAVIAPPAAAVALLADKIRTYRALDGGELVPPWRSVRGPEELDEAAAALAGDWTSHAPLVVKPATGVGAAGVRFLTRDAARLSDLLGPVGPMLPFGTLRQALVEQRDHGLEIPELIVLPYLPGPETSVDVLADHGEVLAAVPRTKIGRRRLIGGPTELPQLTADLVRRFDLDGLVNVQFRQFRGRPALLEINTRPSGGLYQTELAGVNLIWSAVRVAMGLDAGIGPIHWGAEYVTVSGLVELAAREPACTDEVVTELRPGHRTSPRTRSTMPLTKDSTPASA